MARIRVLSPGGRVARRRPRRFRRCRTICRGLTVGFLDNTKHNFDRLVHGIGELLRERYGVKRVVHRQKANAATGAAPEIIAALAKECDLVFAGSAD